MTSGTNGMTGQNNTFAATSPALASDKLMYLGYHGSSDGGDDSSTIPTNHDSTSKGDDSSIHVKSSAGHTEIISSFNHKSSTSTNDGSKSSSYLASAIKNKVDLFHFAF